ncbi:MAG TPA: YraN family protein [Nitrospirota bacterium]|nr:YraN family protein [Nitrospirota bacterium]
MDDPKAFGKKGEELAAKHLEKLGYKVLDKNYRTPVGELDIVAMDGGVVVFVEVKSRRDTSFGAPELAVNAHKRRQLTRAAYLYLTRKRKAGMPCRFDVVGISAVPGGAGGAKPAYEIKVIRDAFEAAGGY